MKRLFVLLAFCGLALSSVLAQDRTITGTVTSSDGTALPGTSVIVLGTSLGEITDGNGFYSIKVPESATMLEYSFIGMATQQISIGGRSNIDVVLKSGSTELDQVVVVGYGIQTREAKTGAVGVVSSEDIAGVPVVSVDKVLSGKMAGVSVTSNSGQPGSSTQIRVRGTSSLNAGNEPLYVIDGIPVMSGDQSYFTNSGNALSMINPNDIASITVLKDAAAASIYGSRAANGVVLITTKSGESGETKFVARASYGVSSLANDNDYGTLNPQQLVDYMRAGVRNAGKDPDNPANAASGLYVPYSLLDQKQTNWMDELTRLGNNTSVELSATGGTEKTKAFISLMYQEAEGVYYGVTYDKLQFRTNVDHVISDKLKIGTKINAGYTSGNDVAMGSLYYANPAFAGLLILPWTKMYNEDGTYNLNIPENSNTNPRATAEYDTQWEKQYRLQGSGYLEWKPIKNLTIKSNNSAEITSGEGNRYWSPEADYSGSATLQVSTSLYRQLTTSNTASYSTYFNDVHSFRALAGQEGTLYDTWSYYIYTPNVNPEIPFPNTGTSDTDEGDYGFSSWSMMSFFGLLEYNYDSKYYFQASLRTDGSSRFGSETRWGTFYSAGASWNVHKESFIENVNAIDELKLRASYGVNGNDRIGTYDQWSVYGPRTYNGVSGMGPNSPGNSNLTWELNTAYNVGVDFGVLDRISGSLEWYYRITSDMLLNDPLSQTSGFASLTRNIGEMSNTGFEALINVNVVNSAVKFDIGANFTWNKNEILDLGSEEEIVAGRTIHRVGEALSTYYLYDYAGVNPTNGYALWRTEDGGLTQDYAKAYRMLAGNPAPKFFGGFNADVSWNGLSLSAFFEYKIGNQVLIEEQRYLASDGYNWNSNQGNNVLNYWKNPGDITNTPKPIANNTTNSNGFRSTRWMENGDFLRIKTLTLSYSLPSSVTERANIGVAKVYASAYNLFTFHDVTFWDPERGVNGQGFGIYPQAKTMVMGLEISF